MAIALAHVALTVKDLSVSVPWYEKLLDAKPVLDEDTDPDFHHTVYLLANGTLLGLHQHETAAPDERSGANDRVGPDLPSEPCAKNAPSSRPTKEASIRRTTACGRSPGEVRNIASNCLRAGRADRSAGEQIDQRVGRPHL